ncbi:MAG: hypothetical protein NC430_10720 [bacterium]|nr:hypothetical protein [bacterium]MCM1423668.1 hypothetical protein [bacterium]
MNISWNQTSSILRRMNSAGMLKSTQDRLERQEQTQKQVDFFEKQKENLKNVACGSVEEIAEKLKLFQSYEDQIAAVKAAYNQEQMFHILDESTERGEKIAEAVEKSKPKTPEERLEEMVEEALGVEDGGELEEIMDELEEVAEELTEELVQETTEELAEALPEKAELSAEAVAEAAAAAEAAEKEAGAAGLPEGYLPFDVRL